MGVSWTNLFYSLQLVFSDRQRFFEPQQISPPVLYGHSWRANERVSVLDKSWPAELFPLLRRSPRTVPAPPFSLFNGWAGRSWHKVWEEAREFGAVRRHRCQHLGGLGWSAERFALLWRSPPFVSCLFGNLTRLLLKVCYDKTLQIWYTSGFVCGAPERERDNHIGLRKWMS